MWTPPWRHQTGGLRPDTPSSSTAFAKPASAGEGRSSFIGGFHPFLRWTWGSSLDFRNATVGQGAPSMTATVGTALQAAVGRLYAAGIDTARLDARLLLGDVLNLETADLVAHPERPLAAPRASASATSSSAAAGISPVSQLLARREFWGLAFRVTADTLIPRPETEVVVEQALCRHLPIAASRSGFSISARHRLPAAHAAARAAAGDRARRRPQPGRARRRARQCRGSRTGWACEFRLGNWTDGLSESFDLIVSNAALHQHARHGPTRAGSGAPRAAPCPPWRLGRPRLLSRDRRRAGGGSASPMAGCCLEIGADQGDSVPAIFAAAGFRCVARHSDLAGLPRCLVLQWNL